jgi:hypothetical protein
MRSAEKDVEEKEVEKVMDQLQDMNVKYATVDLGYMELREFNETKLAGSLKEAEIPYFTTELPHYVKGYFTKEIAEIRNTLAELKGTYDGLSNKNAPSAQELKLLIDRYTTDLKELDTHINQEVRPKAMVKRILQVIKGHEQEKFTVLHFGEEQTFVEIMKLLKDEKVKPNVVFMPLNKFL